MSTYHVRPVTLADVHLIEALEQQRWAREPGTQALTCAEITAWMQLGSDYFLAAEKDGRVDAYLFATRRALQLQYTTVATYQLPKEDYQTVTHDRSVQNVGVVSVVSNHPDAVSAIEQEVVRRLLADGIETYFGYSRIAHFDRYLNQQVLPPGICESTAALWYALQTGRLVDMETWEHTPAMPTVDLTPPKRPDGVLGHHLVNAHGTILGVVPDYMPDTKSRNFAILIAHRHPFVRNRQ